MLNNSRVLKYVKQYLKWQKWSAGVKFVEDPGQLPCRYDKGKLKTFSYWSVSLCQNTRYKNQSLSSYENFQLLCQWGNDKLHKMSGYKSSGKMWNWSQDFFKRQGWNGQQNRWRQIFQ